MLIISKNNNEVLKSVKYLFDQEMLEYEYSVSLDEKQDDKIIYITDDIESIPKDVSGDILIIANTKVDLSIYSHLSNAIITKLVSDDKKYTKAQEEYLFRDGIYGIVNQIVLDFINGKTIDKMIYDTSCCDIQPKDWIFDFDSRAESYAWLNKKNHEISSELKVIDLSNPSTFNTFNDSDKEINYLSDYISLAKRGLKITTIFVVTKDDMREKIKNRFLDILVRKCGDNVKTYFCDIDILEKENPNLLSKIKDGIIIYDDCVYKDTYSSEISLGIVDCKLEKVLEYTEIFNYLINNYCISLVEGGEYVRI